MSSVNRDTIRKIVETLAGDPALSAYVKSIKAGDAGAPKMIFPYISVANMRYSIEPYSTGHDLYRYEIEIIAGTHCLAPGVAWEGNDNTGRKGILQLCGDIVSVIRTNKFDGMFLKHVTEMDYEVGETGGDSGTSWRAIINFKAERVVCVV